MKKGFTIIELLAIIVILAIVALITVPVIRNLISKSKRTAAIDEAYVYIDAVESNSGLGTLDPNYIKLDDTCYDVTDSVFNNLKIKGKKPEAGQVCMNKHRVESAILFVDGFKVTVRNGQVISAVKGKTTDSDLTILYNKVDVGDYVTMTPTYNASEYQNGYVTSANGRGDGNVNSYTLSTNSITGYKISASKTGLHIDQTIDPTELTVWRVIKKNDDNTFDAVSEYTSKYPIYFLGDIGYKNYVGTLNEIANQYQNSAFTTKARIVGYKDGCQTENITSLTYADESTGAGDECYKDDLEDIYNAIGTYSASSVANKNSKSTYYVGSRHRDTYNGSTTIYNFCYYVWDIPNDNKWIRENLGSWGNIRPIITINGSLMGIEGRGTKQKPFKLES